MYRKVSKFAIGAKVFKKRVVVQKPCRHGTSGHGLAGMVVLG